MGASGRRCWAATLTLGAVALVTLILARTGSKRPPPERPPPSPGPAAQPGPEADLPGPRLAAEPDICSELQERSTSGPASGDDHDSYLRRWLPAQPQGKARPR
jgi:hypothetical protein